jgi:hypothetical protein
MSMKLLELSIEGALVYQIQSFPEPLRFPFPFNQYQHSICEGKLWIVLADHVPLARRTEAGDRFIDSGSDPET